MNDRLKRLRDKLSGCPFAVSSWDMLALIDAIDASECKCQGNRAFVNGHCCSCGGVDVPSPEATEPENPLAVDCCGQMRIGSIHLNVTNLDAVIDVVNAEHSRRVAEAVAAEREAIINTMKRMYVIPSEIHAINCAIKHVLDRGTK